MKRNNTTKLSIVATAILISFIFSSKNKRLKIKKNFDNLADVIKKETSEEIRNWRSSLFNANNFNFKMFFDNVTKNFTNSKIISRKKIKNVASKLTDFFLYSEEILLDSLKDVGKIKIFQNKKIGFEDKLKEWIAGIKNFKNNALMEIKNKAQLSEKPDLNEIIQSFLAMEILDLLEQKQKIKSIKSQLEQKTKNKNATKKKNLKTKNKGNIYAKKDVK